MKRLFFIVVALFLFDLGPAAAMSRGHVKGDENVSEALGVRTLKYKDETRKRPIAVELWYPTEQKGKLDRPADSIWIHPKEVRNAPLSKGFSRYPLILLSHGHRGDRRDRSWLADALVRHGFIVASVEHHGNSRKFYHPLLSLKFWDRIKDVTFALDQLLLDPFLKDRLDVGRIGFTGYSLGGMTGLALAGARAQHTREIALKQQENYRELSPHEIEGVDFSEAEKSYRESRIKAVLLICPALFVYPPDSLRQIKIPVGLVAVINDEVLPHKDHAYQIIRSLDPAKLKIMSKEISHYTFLNRLTEAGKRMLHRAVHADPPGCDRAAVHREVGTFAVEFFEESLRIKTDKE